jgi:hypothetical protein
LWDNIFMATPVLVVMVVVPKGRELRAMLGFAAAISLVSVSEASEFRPVHNLQVGLVEPVGQALMLAERAEPVWVHTVGRRHRANGICNV